MTSDGATITAVGAGRLVRYDAAGEIDGGFTETGISESLAPVGRGPNPRDIAIGPDGSIYVAGSAFDEATSDSDWFVSKLRPNGMPDPGFASGSKRLGRSHRRGGVGSSRPAGPRLACRRPRRDSAIAERSTRSKLR